jgi:hypothetical protein
MGFTFPQYSSVCGCSKGSPYTSDVDVKRILSHSTKPQNVAVRTETKLLNRFIPHKDNARLSSNLLIFAKKSTTQNISV